MPGPMTATGSNVGRVRAGRRTPRVGGVRIVSGESLKLCIYPRCPYPRDRGRAARAYRVRESSGGSRSPAPILEASAEVGPAAGQPGRAACCIDGTLCCEERTRVAERRRVDTNIEQQVARRRVAIEWISVADESGPCNEDPPAGVARNRVSAPGSSSKNRPPMPRTAASVAGNETSKAAGVIAAPVLLPGYRTRSSMRTGAENVLDEQTCW